MSCDARTYAFRKRHNSWICRILFHRDEPRIIVPQGYVYMRKENFHSLHIDDCRQADRHNTVMYRRKKDALSSLGETVINHVEPPAEPSNEARYKQWLEWNQPVSADRQARAVQALASRGVFVFTHYEPHKATEDMHDHPGTTARVTQDGLNYVILSDEELIRSKGSHCRKIDEQNVKNHNKLVKKAKKQQKRARVYIHTEAAVIPPPSQCNYERRAIVLARSVEVSAEEQAVAVQWLYSNGKELYRDYEPQNAIGKYNCLRDAIPIAATAPPRQAWPERVPPATEAMYPPVYLTVDPMQPTDKCVV